MIRVLVDEQPAQGGKYVARPRRRKHLGYMDNEVVQPVRWILESRGQVLAVHVRPLRMALPASRTHAAAHMAA